MHKLVAALSFAVLALAGFGIGLGIAETTATGTQVAGAESGHPTNAEENGVHMRGIAEADIEMHDRHIYSPEHDGDEYHRQIADVHYHFPRPEADGDDGPNIRAPGSARA